MSRDIRYIGMDVLEFRLKISRTDFLAAQARQRISLIFKELSRLFLMTENLEVSTAAWRTLQAVLFQAENASVSGVVQMSKPRRSDVSTRMVSAVQIFRQP